jgi:hypothetical protein
MTALSAWVIEDPAGEGVDVDFAKGVFRLNMIRVTPFRMGFTDLCS